MNLRNCRKCGRIFNYIMGPHICPLCREEMDKKFQEVKEYIRENRGVGIHEVAEVCDVEVPQIHQWLKEERLELVEGSGIALTCETCGAVITSGRYCKRCKNELVTEMKSVVKPVKQEPVKQATREKEKERMRFLQDLTD